MRRLFFQLTYLFPRTPIYPLFLNQNHNNSRIPKFWRLENPNSPVLQCQTTCLQRRRHLLHRRRRNTLTLTAHTSRRRFISNNNNSTTLHRRCSSAARAATFCSLRLSCAGSYSRCLHFASISTSKQFYRLLGWLLAIVLYCLVSLNNMYVLIVTLILMFLIVKSILILMFRIVKSILT